MSTFLLMIYGNFDKIISFWFLEANETSAQPTAEEEDDDQNEDQNVPDLTNFVVEELRQCV